MGGKGFQNVFVWPTDPVLQQLTPKLGLYELGTLILLDAESTSSAEHVAPGVLYHKDAPSEIEGYVFTLKPEKMRDLWPPLTQHVTGKEVERQIFRRKRAGLPFTIHWDAKDAEPGSYTLDISGFSLSNGQTLSQEIRFYYQPILVP